MRGLWSQEQPMRGQYLYLSDAPDDGDGALETPLQQLGTEGLLLWPDQSEDISDQSEDISC